MNQSEERHQEEVTELRQALHDADERERKRDIRELEKNVAIFRTLYLSNAVQKNWRRKSLGITISVSPVFLYCLLLPLFCLQ